MLIKVVEVPLCELERAVRELDGRVLVDQTVVQTAKGFVFLVNGPGLAVEFDFDDILCVSAVVILILHHARTCNLHCERNLEEEAPRSGAFLCA